MTVVSEPSAGPHRGLLEWLAQHGVHFELHEHPRTYTARETARVEHIDPATFAKAIGIVADDGKRALVVLDAMDHVSLRKVGRALNASHARLMTEPELAEACPGCDVGATPPVGELFGLPTYVDESIRNVPFLTFHAGSHIQAVRVERKAWERALDVQYADLVERPYREPAWMNS